MTGREQERRLNRREADVSESKKTNLSFQGSPTLQSASHGLNMITTSVKQTAPSDWFRREKKKSSFFQSVRLEERFSIPTFFLSWLDWKNWWFALKDQVWLWYCFIIFSTQTTYYSLFFLPLTTITLSWSVFNSLPRWYVVSSTAPFLVTDEKMEIN